MEVGTRYPGTTEKLPHLAILKYFKYFFKKTQILNVLRILTIPVAFYGEFDTI